MPKLVWHLWYADTAVEGSELYCYNTEEIVLYCIKQNYFLPRPLLLSFALPDALCDLTDLIWRKGTQFQAMTGCTDSSSDGLLVEVFFGFSRL